MYMYNPKAGSTYRSKPAKSIAYTAEQTEPVPSAQTICPSVLSGTFYPLGVFGFSFQNFPCMTTPYRSSCWFLASKETLCRRCGCRIQLSSEHIICTSPSKRCTADQQSWPASLWAALTTTRWRMQDQVHCSVLVFSGDCDCRRNRARSKQHRNANKASLREALAAFYHGKVSAGSLWESTNEHCLAADKGTEGHLCRTTKSVVQRDVLKESC